MNTATALINPCTLNLALLFAGLANFGILFASALTPKVLDWKNELQKLPPLLHRLFWVYGIFIVLTIIGIGTLTLTFREPMAGGNAPARGIAAFAAVFWGARLLVQCFVFDARPYLTNSWLKLGYHALTVTFILLTVIYTFTAFQP
ncbi:hypothetical protein FEM03_00640 [Phragmitibacter flavus]|uniref:DUF4149 domain-containing protein n=1 Tax=Phragmitibacter flavus TaxID=2576071 RepID=A0A5R8KK37_9BACT|nr:hypothetical protein [Phragmitibacter flavus]TLD72617.1 hypothetical protein FEM03_00640 [Phragmitibacter flavus]